jgi:hypothetical protein
VNDVTAERDANKLIIEMIGDETAFEIGGDYSVNPIGFGALKNTTIQFLVRFYYKKAASPILRDGEDNGPLYYVVEKMLQWEEIPTGIAEVNAANEVSKTYVNAQGLQSDKPFNGVNIVITRYSDGTTRTTKVVK